MEDNIVKFPGVDDIVSNENLLGPDITVETVLNAAKERDLDDVIILGVKDDGFYFATSTGDPRDILFEIEKAKMVLMNTVFQGDF